MFMADTHKVGLQKVADATVILTRLMEMRDECFEQTGGYPSLEDYQMYAESDEFHDLTSGRMSMNEFFDMLLNWRKEYAENLHQMPQV